MLIMLGVLRSLCIPVGFHHHLIHKRSLPFRKPAFYLLSILVFLDLFSLIAPKTYRKLSVNHPQYLCLPLDTQEPCNLEARNYPLSPNNLVRLSLTDTVSPPNSSKSTLAISSRLKALSPSNLVATTALLNSIHACCLSYVSKLV